MKHLKQISCLFLFGLVCISCASAPKLKGHTWKASIPLSTIVKASPAMTEQRQAIYEKLYIDCFFYFSDNIHFRKSFALSGESLAILSPEVQERIQYAIQAELPATSGLYKAKKEELTLSSENVLIIANISKDKQSFSFTDDGFLFVFRSTN
ncbi:hypothetical protein DWQ65_01400 [Treponema phagedenis]|uniref:Lipoprotein n=1 Tax=Treponema phagedenis TaxID=162 RepID=A0A0B7GY65_TREPH|nr:hypothetical protein [Treponema phagedenis]QEJ97157.1 hypothetical protein FUT82_03590 [Treponema phagedenis]QEK02654.1 hypothetical protein FUT83_01755 [Treponema phagedenis]QEK08281.1 hypothetical protein FUT81_01735 [Treponema phagedenis]QSH98748.1 hypothetical protein DWQ65_01400 [Treponema phagedenis]CEM62532.1 conserved exported hypothetical protein [Treponema phagedenis]